VINEKIFALETENARDIDLDVGHSIVGSSVTLLTQSKLIRGIFLLGPSEKPVICSSCSSH
jgi:hypothetical protein